MSNDFDQVLYSIYYILHSTGPTDVLCDTIVLYAIATSYTVV